MLSLKRHLFRSLSPRICQVCSGSRSAKFVQDPRAVLAQRCLIPIPHTVWTCRFSFGRAAFLLASSSFSCPDKCKLHSLNLLEPIFMVFCLCKHRNTMPCDTLSSCSSEAACPVRGGGSQKELLVAFLLLVVRHLLLEANALLTSSVLLLLVPSSVLAPSSEALCTCRSTLAPLQLQAGLSQLGLEVPLLQK